MCRVWTAWSSHSGLESAMGDRGEMLDDCHDCSIASMLHVFETDLGSRHLSLEYVSSWKLSAVALGSSAEAKRRRNQAWRASGQVSLIACFHRAETDSP